MEKLIKEIDEKEKTIDLLEESQRNCGSDLIYWSYQAQIEKETVDVLKLKRELNYLELKEKLNEFLSGDAVKREVRDEAFVIIDEHKEMKLGDK